ncbi:MAG: CPBP family intramembrane glutamic endopeptidase [Roseiflexaceae bacterium]
MSTLAPTMQPASSLQRLVARHPVAAFLVMTFTIYYAVAYATILLPVLVRNDILPFNLAFYSALGHLFGSALPAFLVTAALHGGAGVRDLARRCLHWRVGARWYLVALLGLPIATALCASALFGLAPLDTLVDHWSVLFTVVVPQLLILIVFYNFTEEIGWTGFLQDRLQARHGPLKATALVTLPFALWHLPDIMLEFGFTLAQLPLALGVVGLLGIGQLFGRVIMTWLYNSTKRSVLLVGLFHAAFNATVAEVGFAGAFIPSHAAVEIASGVVAVAAVLIIVVTHGRLAYQPNPPQA